MLTALGQKPSEEQINRFIRMTQSQRKKETQNPKKSAKRHQNYRTSKAKKPQGEKLSLKKYCKFCQKTIAHKEETISTSNTPATRRRRKKIIKQAKGYFGSKHKLSKTAKEQVNRSLVYAYRDRKVEKRRKRQD
ncbi:5522_t:CDS:2 [Cetraspora pellucida]|uniref:5522_t:CDS:1 n=1 Tax=Cetraspora pellucida TaxID=1433469 RepID=A0ACA9LKQ4_9GLOM|nr:5522_t:CDS:2 [Cetraspora pellucida]